MCVVEPGAGVGLAVITRGRDQPLEQTPIARETAPAEAFWGKQRSNWIQDICDANRGLSELQSPRNPAPQ